MTTRPLPPSNDTRPCAVFEERLPAWLEGQLDDAQRSVMEQHHESCVSCAMLVADLDGIVESARALPVLTPSRDLWSGIEARLAAPVIPLASRREGVDGVAGIRGVDAPLPARRTGVSIRWFAMAAALLVAVSSGVTWTVAQARFSAPVSVSSSAPAMTPATSSASVPTVASTDAAGSAAAAPSSGESPSVGRGASGTPAPMVAAAGRSSDGASSVGSATLRAALVRNAGSMSEVDAIYEKEIAALRRIVDQRFAELDSATVAELQRNLDTIDQAIEDSRRALLRDPRSGLLSTELDRTLEAKLALLRRVALL